MERLKNLNLGIQNYFKVYKIDARIDIKWRAKILALTYTNALITTSTINNNTYSLITVKYLDDVLDFDGIFKGSKSSSKLNHNLKKKIFAKHTKMRPI